jgi:hypothetical protein
MSIIRNLVAGSGLLLAAVTLALPGVANAQANCEWYGKTALAQQQQNEHLKCGFKGNEWSSDLKAHMTWCASVPPDTWRKSAQKRDQDLATCKTAKK